MTAEDLIKQLRKYPPCLPVATSHWVAGGQTPSVEELSHEIGLYDYEYYTESGAGREGEVVVIGYMGDLPEKC